MFEDLLDPNPPEIGTGARAAVRTRVRRIVRRRRTAQAGGVASVLVLGGVGAVLATGGGTGPIRHVTAAQSHDSETSATTRAATTSAATTVAAPDTSGSPTTDPEAPVVTPPPPVVVPKPAPSAAAAPASVSGRITCSYGPGSTYKLELQGPGGTQVAATSGDGTYSLSELPPGSYQATVTCESPSGGPDIGTALQTTRATRVLASGPNTWDFSL